MKQYVKKLESYGLSKHNQSNMSQLKLILDIEGPNMISFMHQFNLDILGWSLTSPFMHSFSHFIHTMLTFEGESTVILSSFLCFFH